MSVSLDFFEQLTDDERRALETVATTRRATRGQVLMAEGQVADCVIVLRTGHAKVVAAGPEGNEVVLTFRGPGALLGEQAIVDGAPRATGVVAIEPLEMMIVPASAFRHYLEQRPAVLMKLLGILSRRLRDSDRQLVRFATSDTLGRVAARLVELCERHGEARDDGAVHVALPLTQGDLAGLAGSSLESTAKALRLLRRLHWLTTGRRSITVHDLDALRHRAG